MFTSSDKKSTHSTVVQQKAAGNTFFRKAGEEGFFGEKANASFFSAPVQTKLNVSSPDDPQEKEADAVADRVMRMEDHAPVASDQKKEELHRSEGDHSNASGNKSANEIQSGEQGDEEIDLKEEKEKVQTKPATIFRMVQAKVENEKEENIQTKIYRKIYRSQQAYKTPVESNNSAENFNTTAAASSLYHSDVIQRSGRGPPGNSIPFEQSLTSSKGGGSALPGDTQQFMESRFNADFSGVKIHTGSAAENLSTSINAQAFTHGNDIYFNSGKYSPNTTGGSTLLAHELTHTIQQGASKSNTSSTQVSPSIARKNIIQRSSGGGVPSQLTNAVAKAKSKEGKVNANKEGPDGFREGWKDLVDFYKTTFGADKVVSGGAGAGVKDAVSETDIKKKRMTTGLVPDPERPGKAYQGERDAMPSWCGIFVFWALNKSGVPMPKWKIGGKMVDLKAAYPGGYTPKPGDIAYRAAYSHYAIVESVNGNLVRSVNGNTSGEDNMGGQIQSREHPLSNWTGFFNPLLLMEGNLGSGEGAAEEKPKTLKELRKEKFNINKKEAEPDIEAAKEDGESVNENGQNENHIQTKTELSSWSVGGDGKLNTNSSPSAPADKNKLQAKEEEKKEEDKHLASNEFGLQKKQMTSLHCESTCEAKAGMSSQNGYTVQPKTEFNDSSLKQGADIEKSAISDERDRGPPQVQLKADKKIVQRSWLGDAWDAVAGLAGEIGSFIEKGINAAKGWLMDKLVAFVEEIPGYKLTRYILGYDPVSGKPVDKTPVNLLTAVIELIPLAGGFIRSVLDYFHATEPVANWLFTAVGQFVSMIQGIGSQFEAIWNGLTLDSIKDPEKVINQIASLFRNTVTSIFNFAVECGSTFLTMVKDIAITNVVEFVQNYFPNAFEMLCVVLGENPISKQKVDRNGTNIMNAGLKMLGEEGAQMKQQMMENGIFQKCVAWIDRAISVVTTSVEEVKEAFTSLWSTITFESLFHPIDTFNLIVDKFKKPVKRVFDFIKDAVIALLKILRDALLGKLSAYAKETKGYFLITVLIQTDPFTGDHVDFSVENIIHGFMKLMDGGEEQFQQMKQSGAIDRATQKITAAVKTLNFTWAYIKGLFTSLWESLSWKDFLNIFEVFAKIVKTFGRPILRLIAFIIEILRIVIEVLLIIMNFPFDLINNIIAKAMLAFEMIKKDPIGFLKNLLRAIKEGFTQFFGNILTHLWNGLKAWFLGEVKAAGIPIPTDFTVMGIIKWLLAVLDITMEKIWKKLEERIGKEKVAKIRNLIDKAERIANAAGEAYEFIQDVQKRGFMAVMIDKVKEKLSNVWDMVLDAVKNFVMDQIIKKITVKLLSMLDPTGIMAVINSAIALYKAIQSFIKYLRQMLEIVNSFVEGLVEIASGATKRAADFLEGALAKGVPIAIGFFANQIGLNLSERLKEALEFVREKVDKGLTWVIDKLVTVVEKLVTMGRSAVSAVMDWARGILGLQQPFTTTDGASHRIYFAPQGNSVKLMVNPSPAGDYEVKMNEINPAPGAMVNVTNAISVPLKRNGAVVATINVPAGNTSMASLKGYAIQAAQHIDGLISSNMRTTTDATTQVQDQTPDFSASLGGLSSITSHLLSAGASGPVPVTPLPVYGGLINGFAKSMDVKPLTKLGVPGTDVSVTSPAWDDLNLRKHSAGGSFFYVRGHLLNNNVHGSGSTWQNLTPINRNTNAQHLNAVETKVKEAVDKDLILHYNVIVEYAMPGKGALISQIEATPNWNTNSVLNEKHRIITAEANLPLRMNCTVKQVKPDGTDLPASDATYDPKYNISGAAGIIDNAANISQASLNEYYLESTTSATYKDLNTLVTEAGLAIATNAGLTWDTFYNNPANKVSIDNLKTAVDKETLRNVFKKKDLITEERNRIDNQMSMVNWATFTAGRLAYSSVLLTAADIGNLHDRFKNRMMTSKGFFLTALSNYVKNNLTDPNTAWGTFRSAQQLNERAYEYPPGNRIVILSESEIQNFKTTVFDPRINFLKTSIPT